MHWGHCPGEENPADIGSRGALGSKLRDDKLWWCGPQWLTQGEEKWPATVEDIRTPESEEELKRRPMLWLCKFRDRLQLRTL